MVLVPFLVFITCLFIIYALYLISSRGTEARRRRLDERLAEAIRASAHSQDADVRLAREELLSEIPWMNRVLVNFEFSARIKRIIDQADSQITVMRLVLFSATAGVMAFLAVSMISTSYLLMTVIFVISADLPM